jgi:hypothetical protein
MCRYNWQLSLHRLLCTLFIVQMLSPSTIACYPFLATSCYCTISTTISNTCDELVLVTEMVCWGLSNDLKLKEVVAVFIALVHQGKNNEAEFDSELPENLLSCCKRMQTIATNLGWLQKDCGLAFDPDKICECSLLFCLVQVVYEWALGVPFKITCNVADALEGIIVRCITQLDELCRAVQILRPSSWTSYSILQTWNCKHSYQMWHCFCL